LGPFECADLSEHKISIEKKIATSWGFLTHLVVNEITVIANFARSALPLDVSNAGKWKTNLGKWSGFHKAKKGDDKALSPGAAKRELKKNIGVPYIQKVQMWMISYFE
jgi:F0F1-type ATP synthase epsilon subunit